MRQYSLLSEEHVRTRRTIADAFEVLNETVGSPEGISARLAVLGLRLPSGKVAGLVRIEFDVVGGDQTYMVRLPTATHFTAFREASQVREQFDIFDLDGATILDGRVRLPHGVELRGIEVKPSDMLNEPTELDWRIVHLTIAIVGQKDRCYRSVREGLPPEIAACVPDTPRLDCSRLPGLAIPPLKVLQFEIGERDWTLRKLSTQKLAAALAKFGIRPLVPRRRRPI